MSSSRHAGLVAVVERLKDGLIIEADYAQLSAADHDRALGFRVLAAAAIEHYIEDLCLFTARTGAARIRSNQPTRTGRALLIWLIGRLEGPSIPLREAELVLDALAVEDALQRYEKSVSSNHGIKRKAVERLVAPLGLPLGQPDEVLLDRLDALADSRNVAAHLRVNRAKTMGPPIAEWEPVKDILDGLGTLDSALQQASTSF